MESEFRQDPLTGRHVIIAPARDDRPQDFAADVARVEETFDPFLEGNERATGPEVFAIRDAGSTPDSKGWRVRVVKNKFPAITPADQTECKTGLFAQSTGFGVHEVIVECPQFETNMSRLSAEHIGEVLIAYQQRLETHQENSKLKHASLFKNKGALGGASLEHAHSQLIVTSEVTENVRLEMDGARAYFEQHNRSVFGDIVENELESGERMIHESENFVLLCPFASRFSYEMVIIPKQQVCQFEKTAKDKLPELGEILKTALQKLEVVLHDPPYNYIVHTAPFHSGDLPDYRWHIELFPRTTLIGGFEWSSGCIINSVSPEAAAKQLREN